MANLQSQIDILAKAVVKEHINFEDYKVNNKDTITLERVNNEIDIYNSTGEVSKLGGGDGKTKKDYVEENHELIVNKEGNEVNTTVFTYSENSDFGGFLFYDNENKYSINEIGQIVSNSSIKFGLQWNSFIRRINLNEGEIGETQSNKNKNRMIYVNEETLVGKVGILFNEDTLVITTNSDGVNWENKYYIEIFDVKNNKKIQLIVDLESESIVYPEQNDPPRYSVEIKEDLTGTNFDIKDGDNVIYIYRSVNIEDTIFENNATLLAIHLTSDVKSICENAFKNCSNLTQVTISNKIETIGSDAFKGCEIETLIVTGIDGVNPVSDLIRETFIEKQ